MTKDGPEPPDNFRETVEFYLIDYRTPLGKAIDITIIFMNLLVCAIFVIDTYPIPIGLKTFLWRLEILAVAFFIIEYVARLYGAPSRRKQLVDIYSVIDLVAILPTLFQAVLPLFGLYLNIAFVKTIRVFKVFRIFRFLRFLTDPNFFFGSVSLEFLKVARLVTTILIIFFISSGLFFYVERSGKKLR
jgi:voltage-gated potassium channel